MNPAFAEDGPLPGSDERIAALVADHQATLKAHLRAKETHLVLQDIERAVELYRMAAASGSEAQKEAVCRDLVQLVGRLTGARNPVVRKAALDALGAMPDPYCVQYVTRYLKPVDDEAACPMALAAIETAGRLADDRFVPPLLGIVKRSANPIVAAKAMRALGHFGESTAYRIRILRVLIEVVEEARDEQLRSGGQNGEDASDPLGPAARWAALGGALTPTLNELTGQKLHTPYDWFELYEANHDEPEALFPDR
ncbi:MAG: HEAT repeat domain-containing protein [Planctomycetota bacterium]